MSDRPCPHVSWEQTLIMSTLPNSRVPIAVFLTCSDCGLQQNYYDVRACRWSYHDPSEARTALAEGRMALAKAIGMLEAHWEVCADPFPDPSLRRALDRMEAPDA